MPGARRKSGTHILIMTALIAPVLSAAAASTLADSPAWRWGTLFPRTASAFGCCNVGDAVLTVGGSYWTTPAEGMPEKRWLRDVYWLAADGHRWQPLGDFPIEIGQNFLALAEDKIFSVGGRNASGAVADCYWIARSEVDQHGAKAEWRRGPDFPMPIGNLIGGVDGDRLVAVTDRFAIREGTGGDAQRPAVYVLDAAAEQLVWKEAAGVPAPEIGYCTAAVAGGRLFLFGGAVASEAAGLALRDSVWAYDFDQQVWTPRRPLPYPMRDATALNLDGRHILITGGVEDAIAATATPQDARVILSNRCLLYDSQNDSYQFVDPLRLAVADHGVAKRGSQALVIAGEDSPYRTRTDIVQQATISDFIEAAIPSSSNASR